MAVTDIDAYLDALWLERGLSLNTLESYRRDLRAFSGWLEARARSLPGATQEDIEAYMAERLRSGASSRSTARALSCLRGYYASLVREGALSAAPTERVPGPKAGRALPKTLSEADVEALLMAPAGNSEPVAVRDLAMLELLYAAGLRVSELISLTVSEINLRQGIVRVTGKGGRERLVPIGQSAELCLAAYLRSARGLLLGPVASDCVFPSRRGSPMTRQAFWYRIKHWAAVANIRAPLSPHTLRHAFATHLLNHGADIRSVQLLLGHRDLSTTQIYTYVAEQRMRQLVADHHPRG